MSRALTILVARHLRMIPCRQILLKLTLWRRILGVTRTACLLMLATRVSMRSLWLTILCPMAPLRVESMSATFRGRSIGVRLKPRGLSLPFSRSVLFMANPIQRLNETLLNVSVLGFLTVSTTTLMLVLWRMQIKKPIERLLGSEAIIRRFPFITILRIAISWRIRISARISLPRLPKLFAIAWRPLVLRRASMQTLTGLTII